MKGFLAGHPYLRTDSIGIGVCLALAAVSYIGGIGPVARRSARAADWREQAVQMQEEADRAAVEVRALRQRLEAVRERLADVTVTLEPLDETNKRVATLTTEAADTGLVVGEVSVADPETHPRFSVVRIHLRGSGSYPACAAFLHHVSAAHADMKAMSFELIASEKSSGGTRVADFAIEFAWYAERDAAARPTAGK